MVICPESSRGRSLTKYGSADLAEVTENLQSESAADRMFAVKQISIWLMQKSTLAQDFVDQGSRRPLSSLQPCYRHCIEQLCRGRHDA